MADRLKGGFNSCVFWQNNELMKEKVFSID